MNKLIAIIVILCFSKVLTSQVKYSAYFKNKSLRIDFAIGGNDSTELILWKQVKKEPYWAGNRKNLLDTFNLGDYRCNLYDVKSQKLIFSIGFSSLFKEWVTTKEAGILNKSFYQVIATPFPKSKVICEIQTRKKDGKFYALATLEIDPKSLNISVENSTYNFVEIIKNKNPQNAVDIVFISEGYTTLEMEKFISDARKFTKYVLDIEPLKSNKELFNFYAIEVPSKESGADIPHKMIYKNTHFESTFYTFGSPRYLTVQNIKGLYDAAANVPYDHIFVLVNTAVYGDGAFYNHYTCCAVDCEFAYEISSHELAHGLFGLADEYYDNEDDEITFYYDLSSEPWNINITSLADFDKKWKNMLLQNTPIPTPRTNEFKDVVGVFEGGSYVKKGIYSPMQNCKMKSNDAKTFCPVCKKGVEKLLNFLTQDRKSVV